MWSNHDTVMMYKSREWITREKNPPLEAQIPTKILMLDLDGTLITPSSGRKFPKGPDDWKWLFGSVPSTLHRFAKTCYLVLVTNQSGFTSKRRKNRAQEKADFKTKIDVIANELNLPLMVFVATAKDVYRKPSPLIFDDFVINPKIGISTLSRISHIMYVGDAAGRPASKDGSQKEDWSDSDRKFAANIALNIKTFGLGDKQHKPKVSFKTPEEFFKKHDKVQPQPYSGFNPQYFLDYYREDKKVWDILGDLEPSHCLCSTSPEQDPSPEPQQELILLIGPPGSGKSRIAKTMVQKWQNYVTFSQDQHKTKTPKLVKEALLAGDSVVVDNTHSTKSQRAKYLESVSNLDPKPQVRAVLVMGYEGSPNTSRKLDLTTKDDRATQVEMAKHIALARNKSNARSGWKNPPKNIPDVVYHKYISGFQYPTKEEGIDVIEQIPFAPKFSSTRDLITFLEKS